MEGKPLERQALEKVGKNWSKSSLTRQKLHSNIREFAGFCAKNYGLDRIENIKPKMIEAYLKDLEARGLKPSTMADKLTAIRVVADAIGKKNIVDRENKSYGILRVRVNPQPVDHTKLAEIRAEIERRAASGNQVAMMVRAADSLREAFGLRAKESLMSQNVVERDGKRFLVVEGTKGGRPRELEVNTANKLQAVNLIKETSRALGSGTGRIIPVDMSLQQAYDAQRNLWRALGGTRSAAANMHGERHIYARQLATDGATKGEIMAQLGHGRDRSPSAYLGKQ
ncbi:integrase domain-containing protein [Geobacter grbiciae]|uniref:integrase domain-containing protein n=1 Tax=Geobacter grbiciae TaxID=155042 RepID=UPI001C023A07|nr:integrase domain-containing protein [Geobacter grbiciae]MBT1074411.1 integrase domain-containing protein [Geobacter grbiciae]